LIVTLVKEWDGSLSFFPFFSDNLFMKGCLAGLGDGSIPIFLKPFCDPPSPFVLFFLGLLKHVWSPPNCQEHYTPLFLPAQDREKIDLAIRSFFFPFEIHERWSVPAVTFFFSNCGKVSDRFFSNSLNLICV